VPRMTALRRVTNAPVRYVILTHSHWDPRRRAGCGARSGTVVIARANSAQELARMRSFASSRSAWFFGAQRAGSKFQERGWSAGRGPAPWQARDPPPAGERRRDQ